MHRRLLVMSRVLLLGLPLPPRVAGGDRDALDGQDPREHGDRPQRPARPVGLDERSLHPLLDLGLGHGVDGGGLEALPQLRPPHVHQHPRQGQGPGLRDHADRPAPEAGIRSTSLSRSTTWCWRPSSSGAWRSTTSTSRPSERARSREAEVRRELKGIRGKARSQIVKDYVAWPLISGLAMAAVDLARAARRSRSARHQPACEVDAQGQRQARARAGQGSPRRGA